MTVLHAKTAFLPEGWTGEVRIRIEAGRIAAIEAGAPAEAGDERVAYLAPALSNLHSHAFQRAMGGFAERRGPGSDSFWSWRETMYRFALAMTPDELEAVAALLYVEMLEAGFSRVGEFHYLHHAPDGRPYDDVAELAARICAAASQTGIALTLLPVFYARSGFGGAPASEGQRRFRNDVDAYGRLVSRTRDLARHLDRAQVGLAPHSLRAATPADLAAILPLAEGGPVHIHVAEQVREVEECLAWSGRRPVEWLLDHAPVDERWCLIHATHMNEDEARRLARSGAVAGLCPITEANLGDGIFSPAFLSAGGRYGIGTDSNVAVSTEGELRQLEYSLRLGERARNVAADPNGSTGQALFAGALSGGAQALAGTASIAVGQPADLLALTARGAPYVSRDTLFDHWIFARGIEVDRLWVAGRQVVQEGRHHDRERIERRFHRVMEGLVERC